MFTIYKTPLAVVDYLINTSKNKGVSIEKVFGSSQLLKNARKYAKSVKNSPRVDCVYINKKLTIRKSR